MTPEATTTGSPLPTASPIPPGPVSVEVAKTSAGQVLADGNGMTFYVYLPDNLDDPQCVDACTNTWLPVYVTGTPKAGAGVGKDVIGTMKRDGNQQLTLGGQPAYWFAGDANPGDTNGQGVDNLWYLVAPDGSRVVGVG
jgi:predicted lipoprotein with Yx(FWY)xxD motif